MNKTLIARGLLCVGLALGCNAQLAYAKPFALSIELLGTYHSDQFLKSAAEIVAHDPGSQRLFVVNALSGGIDVLDIRDPSKPSKLFDVDLSGDGAFGAVNSVAVHKGLVVAAVENAVKTDNGRAVFMDVDGRELASVVVGALPDMVTFTPDGKRVLVANEGEPNNAYDIDPEGTVSIIDLPNNILNLSQEHVRTAGFAAFNTAELDPSIRVFGPNASVAQDLEPEYITVAKNSKTAWVGLQENNAIAVLDIDAGEFTALRGLGFKDHLLPGNELDVSDQDGRINITNWPVFGIYQPDSIASYDYRGKTYIVTANEGDARDYGGFSEESRFRSLSGTTPVCADSPRFNAFYASNEMGITALAQLRENTNMGRLNTTKATGLRADGKCYEDIYAYGARSFSIWNERVEQVFDSGSQLERITAAAYPAFFNSNHSANNFEARSDDKGPEPEALAVAKLWGNTYAFVGLERIGGVMIYDVSNPYAPEFVQYFNNRDFSAETRTRAAGDLGPEGIIVIEAAKSPIAGVPLLVVANEVSGTTTVFRIERPRQIGR